MLTDVHDVALAVDHDVSVVSVLDLQDIAGDRICCHRLDEIESSFLEGGRVWTTIFVDEIAVKIVDLGTTHFVSGRSVGHDIDYTALYDQRW